MYCKVEDIDMSETHVISENVVKVEDHSDIHSVILNKAVIKPSINVLKIKQNAIKTDEFESSSRQDPSWQIHETIETNKLAQGDCDEKINVKAEMNVTIDNGNKESDDKSVIDLGILISRDDKAIENDSDSKQVPMLHHEINIEKTEDGDDIFYLNKSDIGSESETDHELVENSLDSDADRFGHQDKSDSDSSPVFAEELKIPLKDFLIDSRTGGKIKLRDFSIPLTREDSPGPKLINVSRPKIPSYALVPMERYGSRTYQLRLGPDSDLGHYRCHDCPYETPKKRAIKMHVLQHARVKPFQCPFCPKGYFKEKIYNLHLWQKHRSQIPDLKQKLHHMFVPCSVCDYSTIEPWKLKDHMRVHGVLQDSEPLECKQCNYKCFSKKNYSRHVYNKHTNREFRCDFCDEVAREESTVANHMLNSHKKLTKNCQNIWKFTKIYKCTLCDFRCVNGKRLRIHNNIHKKILNLAPKETYTCFECNFTATLKPILIRHLEIHKAVKEFKCEHCAESFIREKVLHSHLLNQHKEEIPNLEEFLGDKLYSCDVCDYKTVYGPSLREHTLKHKNSAETKWYNCGVCNFKTIHKASIQKHVKTHQDEKDFKCDWCQDKSFHMKMGLANHLLVHHKNDEAAREAFQSMNYKVYSCKLCPFQCIPYSRFKKHMFMAHNDMSYASEGMKKMISCTKCSFKAVGQAVLKRHMVTHESERQYKYNCKLCQHRFVKASGLESHMSKKHKKVLGPRTLKAKVPSLQNDSETYDSDIEDKYRCDGGEFESESKSSLNEHIISTHKLIKSELKMKL